MEIGLIRGMMKRSVTGLGVSVAVALLVGWLGSTWTMPEISGWYRTLAKPPWTPPNWLFGPVWTALYVTMAVAAWLVWKPQGFAAAALPLGMYALQLALNLAWTGIFFAMRQPGAAFAEIVVLWCAILLTMILFSRRRAAAGMLLVPYLAWVTYATALNFAIWRLNS
jgi:tryptophan-rich sensory protein